MEKREWMFRIPVIQSRYLASGTILTECVTLAAIGNQEVYVYHSDDFDFSTLDPTNITQLKTFFLVSADSVQNALAIFSAEADSPFDPNDLNRAVILDEERLIIQLPKCPHLVTTEIHPILFCLKKKRCDKEGEIEYDDCYLFVRNLQAQTWCKTAEFMEKIRRDKRRGKLAYETIDGFRCVPFRS
jgi:hypothetical protein